MTSPHVTYHILRKLSYFFTGVNFLEYLNVRPPTRPLVPYPTPHDTRSVLTYATNPQNHFISSSCQWGTSGGELKLEPGGWGGALSSFLCYCICVCIFTHNTAPHTAQEAAFPFFLSHLLIGHAFNSRAAWRLRLVHGLVVDIIFF